MTSASLSAPNYHWPLPYRETSKQWSPEDGVWMVWWMKYQIWTPILLLQFLNLFWYFLILRIGWRYVTFWMLGIRCLMSATSYQQGAYAGG